MVRYPLACLILAATMGQLTAAPKLQPEAISPEALAATRHYYESFSAHEDQILNQAEDKGQAAWRALRQERDRELRGLQGGQAASLKRAVQQYRQHLSSFPDAANAPTVYLNLAHVLRLLGLNMREEEPNAGSTELQEALLTVRTLEKDYPGFASLDETYYLHALILTNLGDQGGARGVWQRLATRPGHSIYALHAQLAVGDYLFRAERAVEALAYYKKAEKILSAHPEIPDAGFEQVRVAYRLAWCAYRAADLELAIATALRLLEPGRQTRALDARQKIEIDATELLGDALYESNSSSLTAKTLSRPAIGRFAPIVGLRLMERFSAAGLRSRMLETGEFVARKFPGEREIPDILSLAGGALVEGGDQPRELALLEQLALLLPADSLWRARYRADFKAIANMEEKASLAARIVAARRYEIGMASGSAPAFEAAGMYLGILLAHAPNGPDSGSWRLKRAHCQYFTKQWAIADQQYSAIKTDYAVTPVILEVAAYQLVLTRDRAWRQSLGKVEARGDDGRSDPLAVEQLRKLEQAIEDYVQRFPSQERSLDLLIVGAAANRDAGDLERAAKYWQRVLLSESSTGQRSMAIRGVVMSKVESGNNRAIMTTCASFLRLEPWVAQNSGLKNELHGILERAAQQESEARAAAGEALAAGGLLVELVTEFKALPSYDRLYRDGAYLLAVGGDWAAAEAAAGSYLKAGGKVSAADMRYLVARAQEYQLRFPEAAAAYLSFAKAYPQHERAGVAAQRAEQLAMAEETLPLVAEAALIRAQRSQDKQERLLHYGRALNAFRDLGQWQRVKEVAALKLAAATSREDRLRANLDLAKATYALGQEKEALAAFAKIAEQARRQDNYDNETAADVYGEAEFLLATEAKQQFDDFVILDRGGPVATNLSQKAGYFENLIRRYDRAISSTHPQWASQAAYEAGEAAQRFADEVATLVIQGKNLRETERKQFRATSSRLNALAKKYHSNNVLQAQKAPAQFRNNVFVKKSGIRLSGFADANLTTPEIQDQAPIALDLSPPYQWSL